VLRRAAQQRDKRKYVRVEIGKKKGFKELFLDHLKRLDIESREGKKRRGSTSDIEGRHFKDSQREASEFLPEKVKESEDGNVIVGQRCHFPELLRQKRRRNLSCIECLVEESSISKCNQTERSQELNERV